MIKDTGKYHDNMYRFLVSSKKEGRIRTRMYLKDGVLLECQKEKTSHTEYGDGLNPLVCIPQLINVNNQDS